MKYSEMQPHEKINAQSAHRAGVWAKQEDMQRVVPDHLVGKYEGFWKDGYDGKPFKKDE